MALAAAAVPLDFAAQIRGHLDQYSDMDLFVCIFCSFESHCPVDLLSHLHGTHSFVLSDVEHTPLLPRYLEYWRFHAPRVVPVRNSDLQMIDPDDPEDAKLKHLLHNMRLHSVMHEHEVERTVPHSSLPCLFCSELFDGTWHQYLQQLFETHQFNPGRPSNLVFIPNLVAAIRSDMDANVCMFCRCVFPNQRKLKSHLRKKKHMRIPADRGYDRFYMVNYLELDGRWESGPEEEGPMEELEVAAADFDDVEISETVCLICDVVMMSPEEVVGHMKGAHAFDLADVRAALDRDFYNSVRFVNYARFMKAHSRCFVCAQTVSGDYAAHVEGHSDKVPSDLSPIVGEDQLLIPFIEEDPLLTELERDLDELLGP